MKFYIVCGEVSGDLFGSEIMQMLLQQNLITEFRFIGGNNMLQYSTNIFLHMDKISCMGLTPLVRLFEFKKLIHECKNDILTFNPDKVILIDFSGFNLSLAKLINKKYNVTYYIPPKVWIHNRWRISLLKRYCSSVLSIFPFEYHYLLQHGLNNVYYVGNPTLRLIEEYKKTHSIVKGRHIALFLGSRIQEVKSVIDIIVEVVQNLPNLEFIIAGFRHLNYEKLTCYKNVAIEYDRSYDILSTAQSAIIVSGTASLEAGLFGIPHIVIYKTSWILYLICKYLLKVKYLSLVNILLDGKYVKEYIQNDCSSENIINWIKLFNK